MCIKALFKLYADIGNKVADAAVVERIRPELETVLIGYLVAVGNGIFDGNLLPTGCIGYVDRTDYMVGDGFSVRAEYKVSANRVFIVSVAVEVL